MLLEEKNRYFRKLSRWLLLTFNKGITRIIKQKESRCDIILQFGGKTFYYLVEKYRVQMRNLEGVCLPLYQVYLSPNKMKVAKIPSQRNNYHILCLIGGFLYYLGKLFSKIVRKFEE